MIAATAGEPPAAVGRRVLLERAAYRLITTGRTILDVAIEAGYGSNEAFTRAFTRAFGESPARWRRRPAGFQIEAPSDVHFHPPGSLRLPARTEVGPMDLLTKMAEHHVWLVGEMVPGGDPDGRAARRTDRALGGGRRRRSDAPVAAVATDRPDGDVERRDRRTRVPLGCRAERVDHLDAFAVGGGRTDVPGERATVRGRGPAGRDVRGCDLRSGRGLHLRRDDRARAHVRGAPTDAGGRRAARHGHRRPRIRRPDALGRRASRNRLTPPSAAPPRVGSSRPGAPAKVSPAPRRSSRRPPAP
jgi:hypothetical protein